MNIQTPILNSGTAGAPKLSQTQASGLTVLMPHKQVPSARKMDSLCAPGFVDSREPYFPSEFSQNCINGEVPDWNTYDGMTIVRDKPDRILILRFRDFRITITGKSLDPVILSIARKTLKSISPSGPTSSRDPEKPFIESVKIVSLAKGGG